MSNGKYKNKIIKVIKRRIENGFKKIDKNSEN